jgi:flagellar motor component MotA
MKTNILARKTSNSFWILLGVVIVLIGNSILVGLSSLGGNSVSIWQYALIFLVAASLVGAFLIFSEKGKMRVVGGFMLISPWIFLYLSMFVQDTVNLLFGKNL